MEGFNPLHPPTHSLLHQKTAPAAAPQHTGKFGEAAQHLPSEVPTTHIHVCKCLDITLFLCCFSKNKIRAGGQCPPTPGSRRFPDGQPAAGAPMAVHCQQASAQPLGEKNEARTAPHVCQPPSSSPRGRQGQGKRRPRAPSRESWALALGYTRALLGEKDAGCRAACRLGQSTVSKAYTFLPMFN